MEKIYYGISEYSFKQQYEKYKKPLTHKKHRTDTEVSKEYWKLKVQPQSSEC